MNCLYTVNIKISTGAQFIPDHIRRSFLDACFRWDCNYAEINHMEPGLPFCAWMKFYGPQYFPNYDKLLYLDGDMKVSDTAPNPFDLCVDDGTLYAVTDAQGVNPNRAWEHMAYQNGKAQLLKKYPEFKWFPKEEYFNSGFLMWKNTAEMKALFARLLDNKDCEREVIHEQTVLNCFAHNCAKVHLLPELWNYVVFARPGNPLAYCNHWVMWTHFNETKL